VDPRVGPTVWARAIAWGGWRWVLLGLVAGAYLLAELPYLDRYPLLNYDEGEEMAPAYKLATQGIFGSDLMSGFYRAEAHLYYMMPLYMLFMGAVYRVLGAGIWQARLLSVSSGLAAVLLTFALGRTLHNWPVGLLAAAVLCSLQLSLFMAGSGVPFLDIARVVRYDIMVPVWGLMASLCFIWAHERGRSWAYLSCGVCIGLAALSNAYGVLFLPVLGLCLLWADGLGALRSRPLYLLLLGCLLAGVPWALYIARDPAGFVGQMTIQSSRNRFDFFNPAFYWHNLLDERHRYASWVGAHFSRPVLWPRAGIWVLAVAVPAGLLLLARRLRERRLADVFTFISFPVLALLLAATTNLKIYGYLALVMPFLALQIGYGLVGLWRVLAPTHLAPRAAMLVWLGLALIEGQVAVVRNLEAARAAIPYAELMRPIAALLAPRARVLATHAYWLGLQPAEVRSLDLPFYFSNPAYDDEHLSLAGAMAQLSPNYILADSIVGATIQLPAAMDDPSLQADFWKYMAEHCSVALALPQTQYGPLTLYQCAN
jgi:4-amino-4-deoxy-L-arabinose transferase-like glycosyltransferase